jgi:hypothetical protein
VDKAGYIKRLKQYAAAYEGTSLSRGTLALNDQADKAASRLALVNKELLAAEQVNEPTDWNERRSQFESGLAGTGEPKE